MLYALKDDEFLKGAFEENLSRFSLSTVFALF